MKFGKKIFVTSCLVALVCSHITPSNAANAASQVKPSAKQQTITWNWSDDGDRNHRDFSEEDYWSVDELPTIDLQVTPVAPSRKIILERFDESNQEWISISEERTDTRGFAQFLIAPECVDITGDESDSWCDYSDTLRIRVLKALGQKQRISKSFEISWQSAGGDDWSDSSDS